MFKTENELLAFVEMLTNKQIEETETLKKAIDRAIETVGDIEIVKDKVQKVLADDSDIDLMDILLDIVASKTAEKSKAVKGLSMLEKAVVDIIANTETESIERRIIKEMRHNCDKFLRDEYGAVTRKVNLDLGHKVVDMGTEVLHEQFETVLQFVNANEPVFLTGQAGCGKNVLCKQVAKALGLDFYFTNAVTQEYKLTGFTDAMGEYHETQFYKAFKNGGLFMLDEMDASIPEVLVILNSAIANRYFDFPAPIGYVEAHPNFRVIGAGNTFGLGADIQYVGRNQLDMASLDRFALVEMDYDKNIEFNVANGDVELVKFAEIFRKAVAKAGIRAIMSYRSIGRIAKLQESLGTNKALATCLVKALRKDDLQMLLSEISGADKENEYVVALQSLKDSMASA